MLTLLLGAVAGWTTISQAVWGAQLDQIQTQMSGGTSYSNGAPLLPEKELGYLWSMPAESTDSRGLGGGITWAWDPQLCGKMLGAFYQELVPGVGCEDLRAAMRRAFSAWSSEHVPSHSLFLPHSPDPSRIAPPPWSGARAPALHRSHSLPPSAPSR
eukprot:scaffold276865_cov33-Tisochrysis_lutea.AAC.1